MNGYIAFYNGKRIEIYAETKAQANEKAQGIFSPPRSKKHMVTVVLAETNGLEVLHSTTEV